MRRGAGRYNRGMRGWAWGWIDRTGRFVSPPTWVSVGPYRNGLARAVPLGVMRGVIVDRNGGIVVGIDHDSIGEFSEGLAAVNVGGAAGVGGVWGFVDRTGAVAIPLRFTQVGDFREGFAPALTRQGWGYLDPSGGLPIRPQFDHATPFAEGLAAVAVDGAWGYVDRAGRFVIPAVFEGAAPFAGGLGRVRRHGQEGFVDRHGGHLGEWFVRCGEHRDGVAICEGPEGVVRVDLRGLVIGAVWDEIAGGADGVWAVRRGDAWWLVDAADVDRGGGPWDAVTVPDGGSSCVRRAGRWGVVDVQSGRVVVPAAHDETRALGEARVAWRDGEVWTLARRDGQVLVTGLRGVDRYVDGVAPAADAEGWTLVDRDGAPLFAERHDRIAPLSEGLAAARPTRGRAVLAGPWPGCRGVPRQLAQHAHLARVGPTRLVVRFVPPLASVSMIQAHQRVETWRGFLPGGALEDEPWVGATELRVALRPDPRSGPWVSALIDVLRTDAIGVAEVVLSDVAGREEGEWDGVVWPPELTPVAAWPPAPAPPRTARDDRVDDALRHELTRALGEAPSARARVIGASPRRWAWQVTADELRQELAGGVWRLRLTELLEAAAACVVRNGLSPQVALGVDPDGVELVLSDPGSTVAVTPE